MLTVVELRALGVEREHGLFGLIERLIAARVVGAGVLQAPPEADSKNAGGSS